MVATQVNTMLEASEDPNIVQNRYVDEIIHPDTKEKLKIHGTPWKFSETPSQFGFAPKLGEHNEEILLNLGYEDNEIDRLIEINAI